MSKGKIPFTAITVFSLILSLSAGPAPASSLFVVADGAGNSEAVWSNQTQGSSSASILYSYLAGSSWAPSTTLSTIGKPGVTPVMAFDASGGRLVVWETADATNRVLLRTLSSSGGAWSSEVVVSDAAVASHAPWVVAHANSIYVSYETTSSAGVCLWASKLDPGGSVERSSIAYPSASTAAQSRIHSEGGHLWLDWIESGSAVGYSEYVNGGWSTAQYAAYGTNPDEGRAEARSVILGD